MLNFKEKLYKYEADPPAEIWNNINNELQDNINLQQVISTPVNRKRSKLIFYTLTAAASLIIIFLISLFYNKNRENQQILSSTELQSKDSIKLNNTALEDIIKASKENNVTAKNKANVLSKVRKYITIAGPEGQPVKISPKVATLIESADDAYPPKAVWSKKIEKWKQIMLTSTLSPTSTNLLDIVQNSSNTVDTNE